MIIINFSRSCGILDMNPAIHADGQGSIISET